MTTVWPLQHSTQPHTTRQVRWEKSGMPMRSRLHRCCLAWQCHHSQPQFPATGRQACVLQCGCSLT